MNKASCDVVSNVPKYYKALWLCRSAKGTFLGTNLFDSSSLGRLNAI